MFIKIVRSETGNGKSTVSKIRTWIALFCAVPVLTSATIQERDSLTAALSHLKPAERIIQQTALADSLSRIQPIQGRAHAIDALHLISASADSGMFRTEQAVATLALGVSQYGLREYEEAFRTSLTASRLCREVEDTGKTIVALNLLGIIARLQGMYPDAMNFHQEAYMLSLSSGDSLNYAKSANNIAVIYRRLQLFDKAIANYKKAIGYYENTQHKYVTGVIFQNLGSVYVVMSALDSAETCYRHALDIARQIKHTYLEASCYTGLAGIYAELDAYESAEDYSLKALEMAESLGDMNFLISCLGMLGSVQSVSGKYNSAIYSLERGLRICEEQNLLELSHQFHRDLAHTYWNLGDLKTAYDYLLQYVRLANERSSSDKRIEVENIQRSWELKQQQELMAKSEQERQLHELQLKSSRERSTLLTGGVIMLICLLGIILYLYRQQILKKGLLTEANTKLNISIKEKTQALERNELLMKEINHRVKNNLTTIKSLLNLQSRSSLDDQSRMALKESAARVQSISYMHDMLSVNQNLKEIDVSIFITKLLAGLRHSFTEIAKKIDIAVDLDKITIDMNTLIPLALIVNELITNAFKYAFVGREHGKLSIALKLKEGPLMLLSVKDDGNGLPETFNPDTADSLGIRLIRSLAEQINAEMEIKSTPGSGTAFTLQFPQIQ